MTYFLDFDRTLFDTATMYKEGLRRGLVPPEFTALAERAAEARVDFSVGDWDGFFGGLERGEFDLIPLNASHLIFDDAQTFIQQHGHDVVLLTAGRATIQKFKIERSGIGALVKDVIYSQMTPKGEVIAAKYPSPIDNAIFVDDSPGQLASMKTHCPWMSLYEMQRVTPPSGMYSSVKSFSELP